tara:strand:- start:353 stop:988 length:636 start_codon:yes stop_codon:yes gene_type:complete
MTLQNQPGVVTVFFGDGSSSEGDFYEAGNLAGLLGVPVIFLCINNQWAISTPVHLQTAAETIAAKAAAFGMPGRTVDGNDAAAVYDAVDEARSRALAGQGPTLIEAVLYRLSAHTTADDPTRYVPAEELEAARRNDPIDRLRAHLVKQDLWDDETHSGIEAEALVRFDEAFDEARATPIAPDAVVDHCTTVDSQRLARQRSLLLSPEEAAS